MSGQLRRQELKGLLLGGWLLTGLAGGLTGGSFAWLLLVDRAEIAVCLTVDEVRQHLLLE